MQNLLDELKTVLSKDERLVIDGQLSKNKIVELALKLDAGLLKMLLGNDRLKEQFFEEVEGTYVFDKHKFQRFISNKQFLPDSYTAFKNKIGLTVDSEYIADSKEVVLSWAYKDCILEGGQTEKDKKRNEIFWNTTLAPDEIDRLLDPKLFTGFTKFNSDIVTKARNIGFRDNLLIDGNNLLALHSIKRIYGEEVDLIYLDPPYNTGSDNFDYNDRFNHSTWLTFMKNRLEIARELLAKHGSIFIQIDDYEDSYLKVLMDEIFGRDNFRNKITWKRRGGSANPSNRLNNVTEYILWYTKSDDFKFDTPYTLEDENTQRYIEERFTNEDEDGRRFMKSPLQSPNPRPNLMYDYKGYKTPEKGWSISEKKMKKWDKEGRLWFPEDKSQNITRKIFLDEYKGQPVSSLWTDINVINPMSKERVDFDGGQKPEALLERIISMVTDEDDLVLDFFIGSGTTCAAAHKMNRRYIGIEQMDYIKDTTIKRMESVIAGDDSGISKSVNWKGGGSFIFMELKKSNIQYFEKVKAVDTTSKLLNIWDRMKQNAFLSYKIDPADIDSNAAEFEDLSLKDQKKMLYELLDKNQLYINYSEKDNGDFDVSETEKQLNQQFYNLK